MAPQLTHISPWAPGNVWRELRLASGVQSALAEGDNRASVRWSKPKKWAFGMHCSFVRALLLLLVAICLPMVAKSLHVPETAASLYASLSEQSGDTRTRVPTGRYLHDLRSKMVASVRLRSLLANEKVSTNVVSTLHSALVSENSAQADSPNMSVRPAVGNVATKSFKLSNSFLDRFFKSSTSSKRGKSRLARLTTYWPDEGDSYTKRGLSSTGVRLRDGHCAVDPKVIPYGSVVKIPGVGKLIAVDTGPAVVTRQAARKSGRNSVERSALVIDIYCSSRSKARALEGNSPEFAVVTWSR
jgi:3D (Asp-Asp-Asp) domain-containing protein